MSTQDTVDKLTKWAFASLYAQQHPRDSGDKADCAPQSPFITISRQAGAGGRTLARRLAAQLDALDPAEHPWTVWDRQLVERVATEHDISQALVESLEGHRRHWWDALFANWSDREHGAYLDDHQIYRRVAATIHSLANAGRAIIVGRGGVFATADLPQGIHLRLVAPLESRVAHMAEELNVAPEAAAVEVRRRDHEREAFHRRYFAGKAILPEAFTLTLNSAALSDHQMASCILPLIAIHPAAKR